MSKTTYGLVVLGHFDFGHMGFRTFCACGPLLLVSSFEKVFQLLNTNETNQCMGEGRGKGLGMGAGPVRVLSFKMRWLNL
jgi:hypothetical protein